MLGLIAEGRTLLLLDLSTPAALRAAELREGQWLQLVVAFLERMFNEADCAHRYVKFASRVFCSLSFEQQVQYFQLRVQDCLRELESDFKQLAAPGGRAVPRSKSSRLTSQWTTALRSGAGSTALGVVVITVLLATAFKTSGTDGSPKVPANGTVQEKLQYLGGTGWIVIGNYDMPTFRWTWGPLAMPNLPKGEGERDFAWVGDTIVLKADRRVVILGWSANQKEHRLDPPEVEAEQINRRDFTPVTLGAATALKAAEVHLTAPAGHGSVWVRVVLPNQ